MAIDADRPADGARGRRKGQVIAVAAIVVVLVVVGGWVGLKWSGSGSPQAAHPAASPAPSGSVASGSVPSGSVPPGSAAPEGSQTPEAGSPLPEPPPRPTPPDCQQCHTRADGVYQVGGAGLKPGRYHGDGPLGADADALCQFEISTDEKGEHVVAGKSVSGPTEVILKAGTWFTTNGCKPWRWLG